MGYKKLTNIQTKFLIFSKIPNSLFYRKYINIYLYKTNNYNRYDRLLTKHINYRLILDINITARDSTNLFLTNLITCGIKYKFESHTKIRIKKEDYHLFMTSLNSIFVSE